MHPIIFTFASIRRFIFRTSPDHRFFTWLPWSIHVTVSPFQSNAISDATVFRILLLAFFPNAKSPISPPFTQTSQNKSNRKRFVSAKREIRYSNQRISPSPEYTNRKVIANPKNVRDHSQRKKWSKSSKLARPPLKIREESQGDDLSRP